LPRTFGSAYGFDKEIIIVGFSLVRFAGLADVHRTLHTTYYRHNARVILTLIRHYFNSSTTFVKNKELPPRDIPKSAKYRGS
jgi:hypothetical protein